MIPYAPGRVEKTGEAMRRIIRMSLRIFRSTPERYFVGAAPPPNDSSDRCGVNQCPGRRRRTA
jgi:hypothetical protein